LGKAIYEKMGAAGAPGAAPGADRPGQGDQSGAKAGKKPGDDVIDAEFEVKE
jgi:hypothetical protein